MTVPPAERADLWRRVQIGIAGLTMVVLLVSVADLALDRVAGEQAAQVPGGIAEAAPEEPNEPLVDLGVSPAPEQPSSAPSNAPPPGARIPMSGSPPAR